MTIGAISFSNALPFFYPLAMKKIPSDVRLVFGTPSQINELVEKNEVDVGLISAASFLQKGAAYSIASTLGIGATRESMSVCLYTRVKSPSVIHVPTSSASSIALLRMLTSTYWKINPVFSLFNDDIIDLQVVAKFDAFLLIGDNCLNHPSISGYTKIDLASWWYEQTQRPFIFALFAGNTSLPGLDDLLKKALNWSFENLDEVIYEAQKKLPLPKNVLEKYFKTLNYQLTQAHFNSLKFFGAHEYSL